MFCKAVIVLVLCYAAAQSFGQTTPQTEVPVTEKKAEEKPEDEKVLKDCVRNTPCGWAVYERFTREIDYFMKNTCKCPGGKKCLRTDDDISVTAYVYRCRHPEDADVIKT